MRLNFLSPTLQDEGKYAIAALLVLFGCSAISGKAQTSQAAAEKAPASKTANGIVKGRVKLQDSKSHEGVVVRVVKAAGAGAQSARARQETEASAREVQTDSKGDFEVTGLATGDYVFSFSRPGYRGFTTRKLEVLSGETTKLRSLIEMAKEGDPFAVIRGAVLYGVGFTLPHAVVTIERIDGGKKFKEETVSRDGGEFAFRLKADKATYRITAAAPGFVTASQEITIEGDEVRNIALTLQQVK
ncbi:MAG: carboxypeptidase regulatory-like domain-containing protein [Acidobacteria bacterium]|nr:carboxypeptidase regulatory-like domain-containing protein [Acidobacteriota bacterium]MBI3422402.1 carboxypeptidase regulatory-like domain-containing protein [Acidobacteriota bacterium]